MKRKRHFILRQPYMYARENRDETVASDRWQFWPEWLTRIRAGLKTNQVRRRVRSFFGYCQSQTDFAFA